MHGNGAGRSAAPAHVGVYGAGTLGVTVAALTALTAERTTVVVRPTPGRADRARAAIGAAIERELRAGRLTADQAAAALDAVVVTHDVHDLAGCDAVIESVHEEIAAKRLALAHIEATVADDCLITSATSSIPVSVLGDGACHPERLAVTHYIWPAHRRPLVEVSAPTGLSESARARLVAMLTAQGKTWVEVADRPGFLVTRVLYGYWAETVRLLVEGATPTAVDAAMEAFGWPMGPCRVMDLSTLTSVVTVHRLVGPHLRGRTAVVDRLDRLVAAGYAGAAAGAGFYRYDGGARTDNADALRLLTDEHGPLPDGAADRLMRALVDETALCIDEGIVADWPTAAGAVDDAFGVPARCGGLLGYLNGEAAPVIVQSSTEEAQP